MPFSNFDNFSDDQLMQMITALQGLLEQRRSQSQQQPGTREETTVPFDAMSIGSTDELSARIGAETEASIASSPMFNLKENQALINQAYRAGGGSYGGARNWYDRQYGRGSFDELVQRRNVLQSNPNPVYKQAPLRGYESPVHDVGSSMPPTQSQTQQQVARPQPVQQQKKPSSPQGQAIIQATETAINNTTKSSSGLMWRFGRPENNILLNSFAHARQTGNAEAFNRDPVGYIRKTFGVQLDDNTINQAASELMSYKSMYSRGGSQNDTVVGKVINDAITPWVGHGLRTNAPTQVYGITGNRNLGMK